jgi:hypothetical protein
MKAGMGTRLVTVIVDGNNHNLQINGKRAIVQTEITNNIVTLAKCQEITEKIRRAGHEPKKLDFLLSIWTETPGNEYGDFPEECLLNKEARYFVTENRLEIWENNELIYENNNGLICRDRVALADCYND